jgi:predicted CXXCH cytochrome family protein
MIKYSPNYADMNRILRTHPALVAILLLTAAAAAAADTDRTGNRDPHAGISCSLCHGRSATRAVLAADGAGADPRSRACRECHRTTGPRTPGTGTALGFHANPAADCVGCHAFHEPGRVKTAAGDVRTGGSRLGSAASGHCAACHAGGADLANLSPAHRAAAGLYHRDAATLAGQTPSEACLNCHAAGTGSPWLRETGGQTLTFNPHASHPLGIEVIAGSGRDERRLRKDLDPRLRLLAGRLECTTCHDLTAATPDLLVPFEQPYDLCLGCHHLRNPQPSTARRALVATMMPVK